MTILEKILKPLFRVSQEEATSFGEGDSRAALRLETVISTVTKACHITFQNSRFEALVPRLNAFEPELHGFAYEGAGVGLAALDCFLPWKNRTRAFIEGPGSPYGTAVYLGAGMGLARLRRRPERFLARLDPVFGWMVMDGYGFHEGFFSRMRYVEEKAIPVHLSSYARRAFDHGLGRSIWFLAGTTAERVATMIATFPPARQADLWSGVGLACGYTGGGDRAAIETLRTVAGPHKSQLAVGVAIAAIARKRAGNPAPYAEMACEILCGTSIDTAAHITDVARENLPVDSVEPAYEIWRQRIQAQLAVLAESAYQQKEVAQ